MNALTISLFVLAGLGIITGLVLLTYALTFKFKKQRIERLLVSINQKKANIDKLGVNYKENEDIWLETHKIIQKWKLEDYFEFPDKETEIFSKLPVAKPELEEYITKLNKKYRLFLGLSILSTIVGVGFILTNCGLHWNIMANKK
ncbi:hypothetical protein [[Mycoplasma] anseris]|uniref:Uncharacterized protein n=1 Tax=[Mycoplasma] anseris TaxID=92400 RepID=A0A2Z4NDF3_9BACT|nr:hypothetical protein [[Mycoplasma] anseris]AWX69557.1 hypothetical protein DP065_02215 [[Mycoplasma] anseris]